MLTHVRAVLTASFIAFALPACTTTPYPPTPPAQSSDEASTAEGPKALLVGQQHTQSVLTCPGNIEYSPLPAFPAANYEKTILNKDGTVTGEPEPWPPETAKRNKLLPNIASAISVRKINGSASIGPFASGKVSSSEITIDFMKYRSEPLKTQNNDTFMWTRIGVGLRLVIRVDTKEASLSPGNLIAIAASASAGKTQGYITADIIGLNAKDITFATPFTSDISESSITKIIEGLAIIKSKLHDETTDVEPQILARISCVQQQ